METVFLGLGSNLGDRLANIQSAISALERGGVVIDRLSPIYETEPVGYFDQPRFLNAAVRGRTDLSPKSLLFLAKQIEAESGRVDSFRNAPRPIDIDILLYGHLTVDERTLTIPHPRLTERAFVLVPLNDIASDVSLPDGRLVSDLLRYVDPSEVTLFAG